MRILGIDPGLRTTGWGVIAFDVNQYRYLGAGTLRTTPSDPLHTRLAVLHEQLQEVIATYQPTRAAIESTFVNVNQASSLKLAHARGALLLSLATASLHIYEYAPNKIKQTLVGSGHASKEQVAAMVKIFLPKATSLTHDGTDALAIALCHAHHAHLADA